MKVSIVIPTYNSAKTIKRAINSAKNQRFPKKEFEVIAVNDGSTDKTAAVLQEFGSKIKVLSQKNLGTLRASNNGFKAALGQYLIKLDSDDIFEKDLLKEMCPVLEKNPALDFVYCDYFEKKATGEVERVSCAKNIFNTIGIGIMFRKDKFQEQGFFNEKTMFAEYDLLLKTRNKWKGYHIEKPLFWYLRRKESITGNRAWVDKAMKQLKTLYPQYLKEISRIRLYY